MGTRILHEGNAGYTEKMGRADDLMTKNEYFTAVLLIVGPPPPRGFFRPRYRTLVLNAMLDLSRQGPSMYLGYADFLKWYEEQIHG